MCQYYGYFSKDEVHYFAMRSQQPTIVSWQKTFVRMEAIETLTREGESPCTHYGAVGRSPATNRHLKISRSVICICGGIRRAHWQAAWSVIWSAQYLFSVSQKVYNIVNCASAPCMTWKGLKAGLSALRPSSSRFCLASPPLRPAFSPFRASPKTSSWLGAQFSYLFYDSYDNSGLHTHPTHSSTGLKNPFNLVPTLSLWFTTSSLH